ncbi:MAG: MbcA/ParS/Xre antitoxin family protein [Gammaproteobacteria bacterium]
MLPADSVPQLDASAVLSKAVLRAADHLCLKQAELARVLGVHRSAVSRLKRAGALDPASKTGELALLLIRVARSLSALTGGDETWIRHFMRTPNRLSGGVPMQQIETIEGLVGVLQLVDALRGRA